MAAVAVPKQLFQNILQAIKEPCGGNENGIRNSEFACQPMREEDNRKSDRKNLIRAMILKSIGKSLFTRLLLLCVSLIAGVNTVVAQGTAFNYQGQLHTSGPRANVYDLRFSLYDSTNSSATLIAGPLTNSATVDSNGLFVVALDFGAGVFNGGPLFLDIAVRTNGNNDAFTELSPRQAILSVPYSVLAGSAVNLVGTLPAAQLPSSVVTNGASGVTLTGTFAGSAAGLTNLNLPANGVLAQSNGIATNLIVNGAFAIGQISLSGPVAGDNAPVIQAALNSFPTNQGQLASWGTVNQVTDYTQFGGSKLLLGPGVYYCGTNIVIPSSYAFALTIEGSHFANTVLLITNTAMTTNFICEAPQAITGGVSSGNHTILNFKNITIAYNFPLSNSLIYLPDDGYSDFSDCSFGNWFSLANGGYWPIRNPPSPEYTILMQIGTPGDNLVSFHRCMFMGGAQGLVSQSDHLQVFGCDFDYVGTYRATNYSQPLINTNGYPNTMVQSIPAAIMLENGSQTSLGNDEIAGCHFQGSVLCVATLQGGAGPRIHDNYFEAPICALVSGGSAAQGWVWANRTRGGGSIYGSLSTSPYSYTIGPTTGFCGLDTSGGWSAASFFNFSPSFSNSTPAFYGGATFGAGVTFSNAVNFNRGATVSSITGNGSGLTNVNAASWSGLSTNGATPTQVPTMQASGGLAWQTPGSTTSLAVTNSLTFTNDTRAVSLTNEANVLGGRAYWLDGAVGATVQTNSGSGLLSGDIVFLDHNANNVSGTVGLAWAGGSGCNAAVPLLTVTYASPYSSYAHVVISDASGTNVMPNNCWSVISNGVGGFMISLGASASTAQGQTNYVSYHVDGQ